MTGNVVARADQEDREHAEGGNQEKQKSPAEQRHAPSSSPFKQWLWENSLSIVVLTLFVGTLAGQIATGLVTYNQDQREHGEEPVGLVVSGGR